MAVVVSAPCAFQQEWANSWRNRSVRLSIRNVRCQISTPNETRIVAAPCARLMVREALRDGELAASAVLRVRSFFSYPEGRSIESQQAHQTYMAGLERKTIISKITGTASGFNLVACLVALWPISEIEEMASDLVQMCKVTVSGRDFAVVGTLDVNQGREVPGEIQGSKPTQMQDAKWKRAYISNFCVAKEMRRKGIGTALVNHAAQTAKDWGVSDLYVHVVATNEPAFDLYTKCGFAFEAEETSAQAHLLERPRRKLLWRSLLN